MGLARLALLYSEADWNLIGVNFWLVQDYGMYFNPHSAIA